MKYSAENVFDGVPVGEDEGYLLVAYLDSHDYAPGSRRGYVLDLRKFAKWFTKTNGERFTITRVTTRDITDFKNHLRRDRGQAVPTINRNLTTIRKFFGWLAEHGHLAANPAKLGQGIEADGVGPQRSGPNPGAASCCVKSNSEPISERRRSSPPCCTPAVGSAISLNWTSMT